MTDAFLWVADVDRLRDELAARGTVVQLPPTNQTWGTRETGIGDPACDYDLRAKPVRCPAAAAAAAGKDGEDRR
jgi:hypothetical protein